MNTFSAGDMIRFGWETFKKRPWFFIMVQICITIIGVIASQMSGQVDKAGSGPALVLALAGVFAGIVIQILLGMGTISFALKAHESTDAVRIEDLWAPGTFWKFLLTSIVVSLITVAGLILVIIPGIIWGLRFMFAKYAVVDRGLSMSAALAESTRITSGHKWELLLLAVLIIVINIVGALALIVGLLVSMPVSMLAVAHAYRTLEHARSEVVAA
ncbi:MAG: hypothetical protein WC050_04655 [Candidatus Paceibacterota bacterium]